MSVPAVRICFCGMAARPLHWSLRPRAVASATQLEFLADMERAGACTCLAEGLDAALRKLEGWGLLRGRVM